MAVVNFYKETALPGSLTPHSVYFITDAIAAYVKIYVTNAAGVARRIHTDADIDAKIASAISGINAGTVVADIAARDAQTGMSVGNQTLVLDATGDGSVASGGATYVVLSTGPLVWQKISETESLDLIVSWASITGKPTSSPAAIDAAVTNAHTHANMTQLNLISEVGGLIAYNGTVVNFSWQTTSW